MAECVRTVGHGGCVRCVEGVEQRAASDTGAVQTLEHAADGRAVDRSRVDEQKERRTRAQSSSRTHVLQIARITYLIRSFSRLKEHYGQIIFKL